MILHILLKKHPPKFASSRLTPRDRHGGSAYGYFTTRGGTLVDFTWESMMMGFRRHDPSRGNEDSFPTGTLGTSQELGWFRRRRMAPRACCRCSRGSSPHKGAWHGGARRTLRGAIGDRGRLAAPRHCHVALNVRGGTFTHGWQCASDRLAKSGEASPRGREGFSAGQAGLFRTPLRLGAWSRRPPAVRCGGNVLV